MEKTIPSRVFLTLLKEGKRLQDLVDQGAQLLNNPIMFADHDHQPQAFSVNYPADDVQDRMHAQLNFAGGILSAKPFGMIGGLVH